MAIDDSGPGSAGSPDAYRWVCHTYDPQKGSRIVFSSSALIAALLTVAAGHFTDNAEIRSVGILFVVLALTALTHSMMVLAVGEPRVTVGDTPGSLALRYRPVASTPILLTCAVFGPSFIAVGYVNLEPNAFLVGIIGVALAIASPIVVLLQRKKAYLQLGPDSVRVVTIFDDIECAWDDIYGIHVSESTPGLDAVCLQHVEGAVLVRKRTRGITARGLRTRPWEIAANTWCVPINSLVSTMIFLHRNPAARGCLDERQLTAMLTVPGWAMPARTRSSWHR